MKTEFDSLRILHLAKKIAREMQREQRKADVECIIRWSEGCKSPSYERTITKRMAKRLEEEPLIPFPKG